MVPQIRHIQTASKLDAPTKAIRIPRGTPIKLNQGCIHPGLTSLVSYGVLFFGKPKRTVLRLFVWGGPKSLLTHTHFLTQRELEGDSEKPGARIPWSRVSLTSPPYRLSQLEAGNLSDSRAAQEGSLCSHSGGGWSRLNMGRLD